MKLRLEFFKKQNYFIAYSFNRLVSLLIQSIAYLLQLTLMIISGEKNSNQKKRSHKTLGMKCKGTVQQKSTSGRLLNAVLVKQNSTYLIAWLNACSNPGSYITDSRNVARIVTNRAQRLN